MRPYKPGAADFAPPGTPAWLAMFDGAGARPGSAHTGAGATAQPVGTDGLGDGVEAMAGYPDGDVQLAEARGLALATDLLLGLGPDQRGGRARTAGAPASGCACPRAAKSP